MKTRESIFTSYFPTSLYKFVLMILAAILLSSCALMGRIGNKLGLGLYDDYSIKPLRYDQQYEELLKDVTKSNENPKGFLCKKCWDGSSLDNDEEKALCKYQRNLLIGDLIAISDGMCENHMKTILGNEATVNIITGTFTNAFSGAATVITGAGTKSIFSALAFFSNSERSLVNETIYKSVLVPAIIKKINEIRLNERNTIMKKYEDNKNAAYEDYPVTFALADIIKYHQTCSFMVGLQKALEEGTQPAAGQDRASLEQKLKTLVLEKDNRIRELKNLKAGISDEEINKDKYVIYLNGEIDAITKKLIEPGAKATSKTVVEKLAEKDRELQEARKDYEKRTADLTEAEIRLTQREKEKKKAQEDVDTAKDALGKAMQATDVAKQNELKQQHDRYTAALGKATENFDKASKNKGDAVNAKNDADSRVKKLEEDLDKLKKEAAETKS
jgi:hypothetical protein